MAELHAVRLMEPERFLQWQSRLETVVSPQRIEHCRHFRHVDDVQRSLLGEVLVRGVLCAGHDCRNRDISIGTAAGGKPFLENMTGVQFNVSHSGEWVAAAFSALPVGVDVEAVRGVDMAVARRFFAAEEFDWLASRPGPEQALAFYHLWTAKESVLKNVGQGLQLPLDRIIIRYEAADRISLESRLDEPLPDLFLRMYHPAPDAALALCAREPHLPAEPRLLSIDDLILNIR
jgi:4'-phosphopantetheinyl transferase